MAVELPRLIAGSGALHETRQRLDKPSAGAQESRMAQYTFAIEDKEEPIGTPKFVFVDLTDPLVGVNT